MSNYSIGDLVSKINVASRARVKSISIKNTFVSIKILRVFEKCGLILNFKILDDATIMVFLKYFQNRPVFYRMEIVSRPGKRVYWKLPYISKKFSQNCFSGFFILTTSKGFITSNDSILGGCIGGEVLIKIFV